MSSPQDRIGKKRKRTGGAHTLTDKKASPTAEKTNKVANTTVQHKNKTQVKKKGGLDSNWREMLKQQGKVPTIKKPVNSLKRKKAGKDAKQVMDNTVSSVLALDCEMVGVGPTKRSALARICIVDASRKVVYDSYATPLEAVTDYRTKYSGIRKVDLEGAPSFKQVQKEVAEIIKDRIIVGHGLENDLESLLLSHPRSLIRDTAHWKPLRRKNLRGKMRPRKLKDLAQLVLNQEIQTGEHSPYEDALAAFDVYSRFSKLWEKFVRSGGRMKLPVLIREPEVESATAEASQSANDEARVTSEIINRTTDIFASKRRKMQG